MAVELCLLGDIEARVGDKAVDIGHARQRSVLAALLVEVNRPISIGSLVDRVWGHGRVPANPAGAVRTYVSLLRRALTGHVSFTRRASGYAAVVDEHRVDLHRFRGLLAQARSADDDRAAGLFEQALRLWRGEPFAGLDTPWINAARHALTADRQAARLDLTDIRLGRGQHAALLAELADQAVAHPLDERVAGQLMLALYRSGRQGDALGQFQRIRRRLAAELGVDPGDSLRRLHRGILAADPVLAAPAPGPASLSARPVPVLPRQLLAAPRGFTGRTRELMALTAALDESCDTDHTLAISAISGAGGIGKTWLALHWAHRHLDRFPDGQLYVNLRGHNPSGRPVDPGLALLGILDALGVAPGAVPAGLEARAGLYRSLVADRRMLILLDNALDTGQVAPLLPGAATCAVLVTSRSYLGGLAAAHGARCIELDALTEDVARQVLVRYLGAERVAAEPDAVTELVACCAGLPLALGIAAARAGRRPGFPLTALAAELRDRSRRLDALDAGDPEATARAVLSWSIRALSPAAMSAFGLIALAPGPDLSLPAAACLLARPVAATRVPLRELEDASLLQQHAPGRYRMHDLIRLFAAECAERDHPPAEREAAVQRVTEFYLRSSRPSAADSVVLRGPAPGPAGMAWFEAEHLNLLAARQAAAARGCHTEVRQPA